MISKNPDKSVDEMIAYGSALHTWLKLFIFVWVTV